MAVLAICLVLAAPLVSQQAPQKPLAIVHATLHQFEDGPPVYSGHKFVPGETVFLSFEIQNYKASAEQKVLLTHSVEVLDAEGVLMVEPLSGKVDAELAPQDKNWLPKVRRSVLIPPHALSGAFRILVKVRDELGGQDAKSEIAFEVQGRQVEPATNLAVRNVRFLRAEEDRTPLAVAAYKAGDALWVRFDTTGFKIGANNHIRLAFGLSVLNAAGKVLYTQPQAAVEDDSPFYPKRYVPVVLSLAIQAGTPSGEYGILLSVRDEVGNQTSETRHAFRIE